MFLMLWSQIIYVHRISLKIVRFYSTGMAAGRIVRFLVSILDIERCPVKFKYYLKFHGTRTAFCRVIEGTMKLARHRMVPWRGPAGVCTHGTGTVQFWFKFILYNVNSNRLGTMWCPAGHHTKALAVRSFVYLQKNILHLHRYFTSEDQKYKYKIIYFAGGWITCNVHMLLQVLLKFLQSWAGVVFTFITVRVSARLSYFYNLFLWGIVANFDYNAYIIACENLLYSC